MPSCSWCKQRISGKRLKCNECTVNLHSKCAAKYLTSNRAADCCLKSCPLLPSGEIPTNLPTGSLVQNPPAGARKNSFNTARGFNPDDTISDVSTDSISSSPTKDSTQPAFSAANIQTMQNPQEIPSFPAEWDTLSSPQRDGYIYRMLLENKTTLANLVTTVSEISAKLDNHESRIVSIEDSNHQRDREIEEIKEKAHRAVPTSELKINGIPLTYTESLLDLAYKILDVLDLSALHADILSTRLIKPKPNAQGPGTYNSFVLKFKSREVSMYVLHEKRQHGKIIFSDLVNGGSKNEVTIYEMLPPHTYGLRRLAKERGNQLEYKHVWVSNAAVFARKTDSSEVLSISTRADIKKIK